MIYPGVLLPCGQVVQPSREVDMARVLLLDCLRDLVCRLKGWKVPARPLSA